MRDWTDTLSRWMGAAAPAGASDLAAGAAGPAPADRTADHTANRKNMLLLIQLRWMAVVGQVVTIAVVALALGIALPLAPMALVLVALVAHNLASLAWLRHRTDVGNSVLFMTLLLDVLALTAQLYLSGGATNPFTGLYLLQVILGAVLLDARSTWALVIATGASFIGLTLFYRPLALPQHAFTDTVGLHIAGMFVCFVLDAILLVIFVTRVSRNLRERDASLAALRQHAVEEDHIVRMGLLASGAAHELGTPLSSLSVILSDWRRMPRLMQDEELAQEVGEMEAAVQRCKSIVTGILLSAGDARGEAPRLTSVNRFLDELVAEWRSARSATTLSYQNGFGEDVPVVSDSALKQVLFSVLDNALEASPDWLRFVVGRDGDTLVLRVSDAGPGFAPDMLDRFGKPYHSTKGRPGGGLGLFLVVNVVRKLGGVASARNGPNGGAVVTLELPLATLTMGGRKDAG